MARVGNRQPLLKGVIRFIEDGANRRQAAAHIAAITVDGLFQGANGTGVPQWVNAHWCFSPTSDIDRMRAAPYHPTHDASMCCACV